MKIRQVFQSYGGRLYNITQNVLIIQIGLFSWWVCLLIAILFSIGKKVSDKYLKYTYFDCKDLLADAVGILIGLIIRLIFFKYGRH